MLYPVHPDLQFAGLLNPLDAPHHVRATEDVPYREGVVIKRPVKAAANGAWCNIGLKNVKKHTQQTKAPTTTYVRFDWEEDMK